MVRSWLVLVALLSASRAAATPLPRDLIAQALADLAVRPATDSALRAQHARILTLRDHLDGLAPTEVAPLLAAIATPARIEADDPVATAAADLLASRLPSAPDVSAQARAVAAPSSLAAHHAAAAHNLTLICESCSQITPAPSLGGALPLDRLLSPDGGVVDLVLAFEATHPSRVHLALAGDVHATLVSATDGAFTPASASGLRASAVAEQLAVPVPAGRFRLILTLRLDPSPVPMIHIRHGPGVRALPLTPLASLPPPHPSRTRLEPPRTALGRDLPAAIVRRALGLPEPALTLEATLAASRPAPLDLILALPLLPPHQRTERLAQTLELTPSPLLQLALADRAIDQAQPLRARDLLADLPPALAPRLEARLARIARRPDLTLAALGVPLPTTPDAVVALTADWPIATLRTLADALIDLHQPRLASALLAPLVGRFPGRIDLRLALLATLADPDARRAAADDLARIHPHRPHFALDAAERHLASEPDSARRSLASALDRVPSPDLLERAGVLYERLGDRARARDIYSQILALSPTHTEARAHLERLDGELPSPLTLTLDALGPLPITDPKAPFEVLGEELFVRVEADGRATEWHRRILRAQAVPESRDARTLRIRFDPTQTSVKVLSAHIHRAHRGNRPSRSEPITTRTLTSIAEDWYGLYYDLRELAIPFDRLAPGDLIEVSWRRDPLGQLFPGVFDLYELLADRVPKHRYFATVEAPASLPLRARLNENGAGRFEVGDRTLSPDGLTQHFTLRASNLPALAPEVQAPGASEVSPVWQVSSFASWRDVATWYRDLIEPSRVLTPDMRARVTELSRNASPDERRRRLIALVTRDIRYVGLEFGIHGLKPYRTDEVWARGFGDCKDKATLLATLFQAAELPAEVALVRTRRQGRLADPLPSLALFDHAIAYLPDRDQFIDPTALHFGLGELPAADQGAQVLVLNPETHGDLARVPVDPPARNGLRGDYSITVDRQGRGGLQGAVAFYGTQAAAYRELLLDPGTRSRRLGEALSSRYPGLVLGDYRVSDPADPTRPVELAFSAEVPRLAAAFPGELQLPRPAGLDGQIARLAPTETRASPLVLGPPHRIAVQFRYLLPEDYRVIDLPSDASATSSEGHFEVTWRSDDAVVTVTAELTLEIDQVSVAAYPAFRDFVRKLELAVSPPLIARPVTPNPGGAP